MYWQIPKTSSFGVAIGTRCDGNDSSTTETSNNDDDTGQDIFTLQQFLAMELASVRFSRVFAERKVGKEILVSIQIH